VDIGIDCCPDAPRRAFTFSAAPIFRLVCFIIRCVEHDGEALVSIRHLALIRMVQKKW